MDLKDKRGFLGFTYKCQWTNQYNLPCHIHGAEEHRLLSDILSDKQDSKKKKKKGIDAFHVHSDSQ